MVVLISTELNHKTLPENQTINLGFYLRLFEWKSSGKVSP